MTEAENSSQRENAYFNDPESGAEMARLLDQDRLMTKELGGLFAERSNDFTGLHRILDLGCGPGGWVQEVAFQHPELEVVGIDISHAMIEYANAQAQVQHLENAHFQIMDLQGPLAFPDQSFDLVNARFIGFISPTSWAHLMQECKRITRPGGLIRLVEQEWWCFTTSAALEQMNEMICKMIHMQGSFSSTGRFLGILPMLGCLLMDAGCTQIAQIPHLIDFSVGTEAYEGFREDTRVLFKLFQPAMVQMGLTTQEQVDHLYEQMQADMLQDDFRGVLVIVSALGEKA